MAGAYHKHLMELALKQTYHDTCNCIKSPIKLEFEKRQQVKWRPHLISVYGGDDNNARFLTMVSDYECASGDNDHCVKLLHDKIVAQLESSLPRYLIQSKSADALPKIQCGVLKRVTHEIHLTASFADSASFGRDQPPQRNGVSGCVLQE